MNENDISPQKFLYQINFEESARVYHRTDWFLVFHAIMFEAFFAAAPRGEDQTASAFAQVVVAVVGLLAAFLWFVSGCRQRWILWHIGECMSDPELMPGLAPFHRELYKVRHEHLPRAVAWAGTVGAFAVVIPFALTATWAVLIWLSSSICMALGSAMVIVIASIATAWLGERPRIPQEAVQALQKASLDCKDAGKGK